MTKTRTLKELAFRSLLLAIGPRMLGGGRAALLAFFLLLLE